MKRTMDTTFLNCWELMLGDFTRVLFRNGLVSVTLLSWTFLKTLNYEELSVSKARVFLHQLCPNIHQWCENFIS